MNILTFRDHQISQRTDGFVNLSQMAKANSKRLDVWLKTKETQAYLKAAQESIYHHLVVNAGVVQVAGFGRNKQTWGHPLVALHLEKRGRSIDSIAPSFLQL